MVDELTVNVISTLFILYIFQFLIKRDLNIFLHYYIKLNYFWPNGIKLILNQIVSKIALSLSGEVIQVHRVLLVHKFIKRSQTLYTVYNRIVIKSNKLSLLGNVTCNIISK